MTMPSISDKALRQLAKDDPQVAREYERRRQEAKRALYPMPGLADVQRLHTDLVAYWQEFNLRCDDDDEVRFLNDDMPKKWKQRLAGDRRIRARLAHNEVLRVTALLTRNPYKVTVLPSRSSTSAKNKAKTRERFAKALFPTWEAMSRSTRLRRLAADSQNSHGLGYWEFFLTDAYERIKDQLVQYDGEDDKAYEERTDELMKEAGLPFCLRTLDRAAVYIREDSTGAIDKVIIAEKKSYRHVWADARARMSDDQLRAAQLPAPSDQGVPIGQSVVLDNADVETLKYYDPVNYMWVVNGQVVEAKPHGLPGVPVFRIPGIEVASPRPEIRYQGITWGMGDNERALNDLLTDQYDVTIEYDRPKFAVEFADAINARPLGDPQNPARIDLSKPGAAQIPPGGKLVDINAAFKVRETEALTTNILNLWQRSALNPIAQGAVPGADTSGYAMNLATGQATDMYGTIIDNHALAVAAVIDFAFATVKQTIRDRVWIQAPSQGARAKYEWLSVGPDDIDGVPVRVEIDPTTEANKLAKVQMLQDGNERGYIRRERVQVDGFGVEDVDAEDDEIIVDSAKQQLAGMLVELAKTEVLRQYQATPSGGGVGVEGVTPGAELADPNAPPDPGGIPPALAGASQGQPGSTQMSPSIAGQNNGYQPPSGPVPT